MAVSCSLLLFHTLGTMEKQPLLTNLSEVDMYVNLNALVHSLSASLFMQTFMTEVPTDIEKTDSDLLYVASLFRQIDLALKDVPANWVEITGDEEYVKHSLLDIS